jgi:hypothetical protein
VRVAVPTETRPGERRVALVPDAVARLREAGLDVVVQSGAGGRAFFPDASYRRAGAEVVDADVLADADIVTTVAPLSLQQAQRLRQGAITVGFLPVGSEADLVAVLREKGVISFSMEALPRISRAQSLGYRRLHRLFVDAIHRAFLPSIARSVPIPADAHDGDAARVHRSVLAVTTMTVGAGTGLAAGWPPGTR